jgi:hypothetical protein
MPKYKQGDVLEIMAYWDQGYDKWRNGIILIDYHEPLSAHTEYGLYYTTSLKGDVNWLCVNAMSLDCELYVRRLGNITTDRALRLLFAPKSKQRTNARTSN